MQKYGILKDGNLSLSDVQLDGYKPVIYGSVPDFDQTTQYVVQDIVEHVDHIEVNAVIQNLDLQDTPIEMQEESVFVENLPWKEVKQSDEEKRLTLLEDAVLTLMME